MYLMGHFEKSHPGNNLFLSLLASNRQKRTTRKQAVLDSKKMRLNLTKFTRLWYLSSEKPAFEIHPKAAIQAEKSLKFPN
ncbi:hypothetical protein D3H55_11990 [Bacillus salacetis]|uniref:Uncharacterized protein n=1 Tax=Bacillus salacetis TaxID=2315464 RepID=A0A3A1QX96_9BACI|nr:hypothetical protein D3H55_11990 [Bacillus salacetis]